MKQNKRVVIMSKITKSFIVSIFVNIFIMAMEIIAGIIGNSISLVASGIHAISDLLTDLFSLLGEKLSNKPANKDHPFGFGKLENIFSMGMGFFIIGIGIVMLKDVFNEQNHIPSIWLLLVIFISMSIRYICSNYLMLNGLKYNSSLLINNAKEGKMDAISSFFLLFVIVLSQFSNKVSWLKYIDLAGGVLISALIIYVGINIIHEEVSDLIGKQEKNENIEKVENLNLIKFGHTYLVIFAIYFKNDIPLSKADNERNNLEKEIKEKYNLVNKVILKMHFKGEDKNARITRS